MIAGATIVASALSIRATVASDVRARTRARIGVLGRGASPDGGSRGQGRSPRNDDVLAKCPLRARGAGARKGRRRLRRCTPRNARARKRLASARAPPVQAIGPDPLLLAARPPSLH